MALNKNGDQFVTKKVMNTEKTPNEPKLKSSLKRMHSDSTKTVKN